MSTPEKFIGLEDEITLRISIRNVFKNEGMVGVYKVLGELATSMQIVAEIAEELLLEENKKKGN